MSRIEELIKEKCPNGVKRFIIGDICKVTRGRVISKQELKENEGEYPVYSSQTLNNGIFGKINTFDFDGEYVQWTTDGANAGSIFYRNGKFSVTNVCGLLKVKSEYREKIRTDYLAYSLGKEAKKFVNYATSNPKLMSNVMSKISVLIPPIEVQGEIVRILDKFSELESELESELDARKKQYEFWKEKLLNIYNVDYKPIEAVATVITDYVENGSFRSIADNVTYKNVKDYAVLLRTVDYSNGFNPEKFIYIDKHAYNYLSKTKLFGGEIIINNVGAGVGTTFLCPNLNIPMSLAPNAIMLKTSNNKFYYYWFNSRKGQESIETIIAKSAMPKFNKTGFRKLMVPVPSMGEQQRIVKILDKFDKLVNDISEGIPAEIEARRKQYEYYRNKLLDFKEFSNEEY